MLNKESLLNLKRILTSKGEKAKAREKHRVDSLNDVIYDLVVELAKPPRISPSELRETLAEMERSGVSSDLNIDNPVFTDTYPELIWAKTLVATSYDFNGEVMHHSLVFNQHGLFEVKQIDSQPDKINISKLIKPLPGLRFLDLHRQTRIPEKMIILGIGSLKVRVPNKEPILASDKKGLFGTLTAGQIEARILEITGVALPRVGMSFTELRKPPHVRPIPRT